jgi:hypothetical protein
MTFVVTLRSAFLVVAFALVGWIIGAATRQAPRYRTETLSDSSAVRIQKCPSCRCLLAIRERMFAKKEIGTTEPIRPSRCVASSGGHKELGGRNVACQT